MSERGRDLVLHREAGNMLQSEQLSIAGLPAASPRSQAPKAGEPRQRFKVIEGRNDYIFEGSFATYQALVEYVASQRGSGPHSTSFISSDVLAQDFLPGRGTLSVMVDDSPITVTWADKCNQYLIYISSTCLVGALVHFFFSF